MSDARTEGSRVRFSALVHRFFDAWIEAEPEEATTLGLADSLGRLRDPSSAAEVALARSAQSALTELDAIERERPLDREEPLDAWAIRAHGTERVLAADRSDAETAIEALPYELMMLAHAGAHCRTAEDRRTVAHRFEALPSFIAAHREALSRGIRAGRPFSIASTDAVIGQLGGAAADLDEIALLAFSGSEADESSRAVARCSAASAATHVLEFVSFLRDEVKTASGATDVVALGEKEYERRISDWWKLGSLDAIRRRATDELADTHRRIVEAAAEVATTLPDSTPVRSFQDAKKVLDVLLTQKPSSPDEVVAMYEREIQRSTELCRNGGWFSIPEVCRCDVLRAPSLWRRFATCTNWPAPLLGCDAPGACAVVADPELHRLVNAPSLAVHEAVPGHFLQSRAWQLRFGKATAPVRFLSVPDECGLLRGAWIPHFMIEGWAVFAEARMEEAGFHDAESRLFHLFCRAIHAARALGDIGLHTEEWPRTKVAELVSNETGWPLDFGEAQAVRYARSGMQALGYSIGHRAIEDLRQKKRVREGAAYDELAFQSALLDVGPVPPALLEDI